MLDDKQLLELTRVLSNHYFGKEFSGQARLNSRLRTSAGRYVHRQKTIEVNPKYIAHYGQSALLETLKHELIHFHYPRAGHGAVFIREAKRIGCNRFCEPLPGSEPQLIYRCLDCGQIFRRRRTINTRKYRCGKCRGQLVRSPQFIADS